MRAVVVLCLFALSGLAAPARAEGKFKWADVSRSTVNPFAHSVVPARADIYLGDLRGYKATANAADTLISAARSRGLNAKLSEHILSRSAVIRVSAPEGSSDNAGVESFVKDAPAILSSNAKK